MPLTSSHCPGRVVFPPILWVSCSLPLLYLGIQGGAKIGLQLFIWKIIQLLTNNNTRINSVFHILTTLNLLFPHPVYFLFLVTLLLMFKMLWENVSQGLIYNIKSGWVNLLNISNIFFSFSIHEPEFSFKFDLLVVHFFLSLPSRSVSLCLKLSFLKHVRQVCETSSSC